MKSEEPITHLLKAVDTACWCWAVQQNAKRKGQVDWKSAFNELCEAYEWYQQKTSDLVAIIPEEPGVK